MASILLSQTSHTRFRETLRWYNDDMRVWKYGSDGSIDTTFNQPDGYASYDNGEEERGRHILVDSNGNVLVSGLTSTSTSDSRLKLWRIIN
jgi:hypothetical protein